MERQEFTRFLCYLAIKDYQADNKIASIEKLRSATIMI